MDFEEQLTAAERVQVDGRDFSWFAEHGSFHSMSCRALIVAEKP